MTLEFEFMKQIEYKFLNPKGMQVFLNAPKQPWKAHNKSITRFQVSEYDKNNEYELWAVLEGKYEVWCNKINK